MEPTGHYWFCLGVFLRDNGIKPVLVNPHHVKKSKEFDDNSQSKNDRNDACKFFNTCNIRNGKLIEW